LRSRALVVAAFLTVSYGCVSTGPQVPKDQALSGMASWYGEEFAGRTTANGEIFDPLQLTAAHRTLPFGTIVEVRNPRNGATVKVRINDRGPFVGNRVIDLSYAAADKLKMVETGVGEVELRVLKMGAGDREPPQPIVVRAGVPASPAETAPKIAFPLPSQVKNPVPTPPEPQPATASPQEPAVESVTVQVEKEGVPVRRQVAADGRTIVEVPAEGGEIIPPRQPAPPRRDPPPAVVAKGFVLQLGAFQSPDNAQKLADRVRAVYPSVYVDRPHDLHRVRVGPFPTREKAIEAREKLETAGFPSMVVSE
jgi:rare lipoprotein A